MNEIEVLGLPLKIVQEDPWQNLISRKSKFSNTDLIQLRTTTKRWNYNGMCSIGSIR